MLTRRLLLAGMIAGACFISACHKKPAAPEPPSAAAIAKAQTSTSHPAWLHAHLPAGAVGYLRVPSPWTLAGATPIGTALDSAAVNARQLAVVAQLRKAAAQQPELAHTNVGALIGIFFARLASPLEAVMVDPTGMPTPNARLLLAMQLDVPDAGAVQAMFASVPQPALQLTAALDSHGDGQLAMGARVHFDAASKRLFLLAGMRPPTQDDLNNLLASLKSGASAAPGMAAMEPRIDASGQGLFAWFKLKGLAGLAASRLPPELAGSLPADLAEHTDAIALGMGAVHGHGRLSILLHAPGARLFGYLAPKLDFSGLEASGMPRWAFTMALPTHDAVQKFDGQLKLELGPKGAATWQALGARLQSLGVPDLATLTGMFGPEWVVFGDDQGSFSALRLRDAKAFHAQLAELVNKHHWQTGTGTSGDAKVHWLSAPGFGGPKKNADAGHTDANGKAMLNVLQRLRTRLYWVEEGNWLVFAEVPQALADRAAAKHTKLSDWFAEQDYAPSTWLGVTAVSHDAQRDAYYRYIRTLVALGDLLGQPVDIMDLPSAGALHLPQQGQIGMALDMRADAFAIKIDYAQLPTELIQGHGGMSAVAVTAILAAIAIPAYQDYVIRAQVSEGVTLADGAKTAVAEYRAERGRLPHGNADAGLAAAVSISGAYVASVSIEDGVIHVLYGAPPRHKTNTQLAGKSLLLTPQVSGMGLTWVCSSPDIKPKYLPSACRPSPQSQVPAR